MICSYKLTKTDMPYRKKLNESLKFMILIIILMLIGGTFVFSFLEGWSLTDSFYFVSMTATTVGYGDLTPSTTLSKMITIFYSLMIIPIILYAFMAIAKFEVERVYKQIHRVQRKQQEEEVKLVKTERKLRKQEEKIEDQEEDLEMTEKKLSKQTKINIEQEEELEGHQKKIIKQEKELAEQGKELEMVEEIVEDVIEGEVKSERIAIKKDLKGIRRKKK